MGRLTVGSVILPSPNPQAEVGDRYRFGEFELCEARRQLWRNGCPVPLTARALDLLLALVRNPGRVLTREVLKRHVWGNLAVEDSNLTVHLCLLRKALGAGQSYIATVSGRGYQFVEPVISPAPDSAPAPPLVAVAEIRGWGPALRFPDLGPALTRLLVVALAQAPGIHVCQAGGRASWRCEASYQELGSTLRVTAELIRTQDGAVVWAERRDFDARAAEAGFALQDSVVNWLRPEIAAALRGGCGQ